LRSELRQLSNELFIPVIFGLADLNRFDINANSGNVAALEPLA